ncbi:MAG TPA: hypothetical protein DD706_09460 [Nitrospiraceae bacterium]|nr:hypothetical protein [Nitrospiraceae bacterium]
MGYWHKKSRECVEIKNAEKEPFSIKITKGKNLGCIHEKGSPGNLKSFQSTLFVECKFREFKVLGFTIPAFINEGYFWSSGWGTGCEKICVTTPESSVYYEGDGQGYWTTAGEFAMNEDLTNDQLTQLLQTAVDAAHVAAVPIRGYFESQDLRIKEKSDGSPVTQADQEAEALIRVHLLSKAKIGPLDILGEEEGLQGTGTRWQWIVDPIDGTRSFIHGIPLFGTLIALLDTQENMPLVGVIHHPMLGLTYAAAKGQGTTCQGKVLHLTEHVSIEEAIIGVGDFAEFSRTKREGDYQHLLAMSGYVRGYTDCFGHGLVISGGLAAMVDPALNLWDILATQILIEEAGGVAVLRPSSVAGKVDAIIGNRSLVHYLVRELSF